MVSIAAFQAVDPGSIPGRRNFLKAKTCLTNLSGLDLGDKTDTPLFSEGSLAVQPNDCPLIGHSSCADLPSPRTKRRGGRVVKALDC